jgi:hypothetical protein
MLACSSALTQTSDHFLRFRHDTLNAATDGTKSESTARSGLLDCAAPALLTGADIA